MTFKMSIIEFQTQLQILYYLSVVLSLFSSDYKYNFFLSKFFVYLKQPTTLNSMCLITLVTFINDTKI